jgi:predicted Holliday junction resolvase-like endonuclease
MWTWPSSWGIKQINKDFPRKSRSIWLGQCHEQVAPWVESGAQNYQH